MITDDRLDQLVRATLEWQAGQAAVGQPSLQTATRRLAERLEPSRMARRPGPAAVPATRGALRLIAIVLLLVAMLATVVVVGSLLLRPPPPPLPGPFGFASACGYPIEHGVLLQFGTTAGQPQLFPNGSLVTQRSLPEHEDESPLTRAEYVEGVVFRERRLTQRGVDLVRERVAEVDLTPGCRLIRTRESSGHVTAATEDGLVSIGWISQDPWFELIRLATPEEEAELGDLAADLEHLESWLPPDGWIDPVERPVQPDRWLVRMTLSDPIGSDRGYDGVALPGGVTPASFGEAMGVDPSSGRPARCGIVDRADALLLAQSMDSVGALTWIGLLPAFPEDVDCEWLAAGARHSFDAEDQPLPTPNAADDLGEIDPCSLVPQDAALAIAGRDDRRSGLSWELGVPGRMCWLFEERALQGRARVHVHPRSVDEEDAAKIARGVLGHGVVEDSMADWPALLNDCMAADLPCVWGIAAWSEPYLVLVEIDARRDVTPQAARSFVEAVIEEMRRLHH